MVFLTATLLTSVMLAASGLALPTYQQPEAKLRTVYQFPNNTWIENFAVRRNGQILGNDLLNGSVYLIDPKLGQSTKPPVVASFGRTTALTGIAEVEEDVFYVQGAKNSNAIVFQIPPNSSSIWRVDMRPYARTGCANVQKVADVPQLALPNGMTLLSRKQGTVLIADSVLGQIWCFNVYTGRYEVVIDEPVLKSVPGMVPPFGVNGLKVIGSTLYFSNTNQGLVGTFQIGSDGRATGPAQIISSGVPNIDDFAVGPDGSIWAAENSRNTLVRVLPGGEIVTIAGGQNSTELVGPVSARFGRTPKDKDILYISTDGLLRVNGTVITSDGKIAAYNTRA